MLVIPISSRLYHICQELAQSRRMVFVTGLPGVGKSLLIQQLALIAGEAGRKIHLLQYNIAREPFETESNISKYPEVEGFTDPAIRKAVGLWAREAVWQWHNRHPEPQHMLIGELPLIGNRLIELVAVHEDRAEPVLSSEQALFVIPVPSWEVREVIEATRARTIAEPQHEREKLDAPPNVLQALWQEVNGLARQIGLTKASPQTPYNPYIYGGVYEALLRHRHAQSLLIDQVLRPMQSVYEMGVVAGQLRATPAEVEQFMQQVEKSYTSDELHQAVAHWHAIITDNPKAPDPGPPLRLPLPEGLPGAAAKAVLTANQLAALRQIMALPLDAGATAVVPVIDIALAELAKSGATAVSPTQRGEMATTHKFDIYDSYFNVSRSYENEGITFLMGLLQSYRNVIENLQIPPDSLTVIELPLLRMALETTLHQFNV